MSRFQLHKAGRSSGQTTEPFTPSDDAATDQQCFPRAFRAMGSPCEIQLFGDDVAFAQAQIEQIVTDVQRLERKYSRYLPDSYLSAINRVAAEGGEIGVDEETAGLLNYAATCHALSDGLFDITCGVLRQAWRFSPEQMELPDALTIDRLRERVGWNRIRWNPPRLEFTLPGQELDFGGIVKEYAVDRAASHCSQVGIGHGIINLGGDVRVIGTRPDGTPWRVGISHPRNAANCLLTVPLVNGAVASSGDYERRIMVGDRYYGHILNPRTGWPVTHLAAVSVIADQCIVAGSASTIAMLKDVDGPEWLENLGLPHLWVTVQGQVGGSLMSVEHA